MLADGHLSVAVGTPARHHAFTVARCKTLRSAAGYGRRMLQPGDTAPDFELLDQNENEVKLSDLRGRKVLVYFYPKADTPGCTKQACGLNDVLGDVGETVILGISPDKPPKQAKFAQKYSLGFQLLSDPDHTTAEAFDVWKQKSMYGRTYMGIERSAFLVGEDGTVSNAWYKVSPADTPKNLLQALGR
jgi:thioredoxin-dependent peroxiredoxin